MAEKKHKPGPPPKRRGEDENRGRDRASGPREDAWEGGHEPGKFRDDPQRSPEAGRKVGGGREDS
jgi:general stress protein YciG